MSHKRSGSVHKNDLALVIHHNPRERRRFVHGLSQAGFATLEAEGWSDALPLAFRMAPHLIFLEVHADDEKSESTFTRLRAFTDAPIIILTDKTTPSMSEFWEQQNAAVLIQPASVVQAIAASRTLRAASATTATRPSSPRSTGEQPIIRLNLLFPREVIAIDRALQEVGEYGEVHLQMHEGRLRSLTKFNTQVLAYDRNLFR